MKNIVITRRISLREALYYLATILSLAAVPVRAATAETKALNIDKLFKAIDTIRYADLLDRRGYESAAETRLRIAGYSVRSVASSVRREPNMHEAIYALDSTVSVLVVAPGTGAVERRVLLSLNSLGDAIPRIASQGLNQMTAAEKIEAADVDVDLAQVLVVEGLLEKATDVIAQAYHVLRSVPGLGATRAREALMEALIVALDDDLSTSTKAYLILDALNDAERALERSAFED